MCELNQFFEYSHDQKSLETQFIGLEESQNLNEIMTEVAENIETQFSNFNLNSDDQNLFFDEFEKECNHFSTYFVRQKEIITEHQIMFFYEIPLQDNRIRLKLNDLQKWLITSVNQEIQKENLLFFVAEERLRVGFTLHINEIPPDEKIQYFIIRFLLQIMGKTLKHLPKIVKIINKDQELEIILKEHEELNKLVEDFQNINLMLEAQNQKSLIGRLHYNVKNILVIAKDNKKKTITFQYEKDNNLYQSSYQEVELNEHFANFQQKFQFLSSNELDENQNRTVKLLISYGIEQNSNIAYRLCDASYNLEQFLCKENPDLKHLIEIIISVAKGLQLLHLQNFSLCKLCTKAIYFDKKGKQVRLDVLHKFVEQIKEPEAFQWESQEENIQNLGNLIEYLLFKNIVFLSEKESNFLNVFEEKIMNVIELCKIRKERKQLKLEGLIQWFTKFLQISQIS